MWCRNASNQLSALVDGELGPTQERVVRNHVENCPHCAQELTRMRSLVQLTRGIPMEAVPAGLYSRTLTRLAYVHEAPAAMAPVRRRNTLPGMWLWPAMAGAAAAVVIAGLTQPPRPPHISGSYYPAPTAPAPAVPAPAAPVNTAEAPVVDARQQPTSRTAVHPPQSHAEIAQAATAPPTASPSAAPAATRVANVTRASRPAPRVSPADVRPVASRSSGGSVGSLDSGNNPTQLEQPARDPTPPTMMAEVPTAPAEGDEVRTETPEMAAGIDRDTTMRMAGFTPEPETTTGEDEGAQMLRMYLSERNRTVPQPPAIGMGRRRHSKPL